MVKYHILLSSSPPFVFFLLIFFCLYSLYSSYQNTTSKLDHKCILFWLPLIIKEVIHVLALNWVLIWYLLMSPFLNLHLTLLLTLFPLLLVLILMMIWYVVIHKLPIHTITIETNHKYITIILYHTHINYIVFIKVFENIN